MGGLVDQEALRRSRSWRLLVELPKLNVAGSNPVTCLSFRRGKFHQQIDHSAIPEARGNSLCAHLKDQNEPSFLSALISGA
jgi:hypothetical protein